MCKPPSEKGGLLTPPVVAPPCSVSFLLMASISWSKVLWGREKDERVNILGFVPAAEKQRVRQLHAAERTAKAAEEQLAVQKQALQEQQAAQRATAAPRPATVPEPQPTTAESHGRHARQAS